MKRHRRVTRGNSKKVVLGLLIMGNAHYKEWVLDNNDKISVESDMSMEGQVDIYVYPFNHSTNIS